MPEIRGEDPRAHFTSQERDALAKEIAELIKTRLTEGQGNAPGCKQCVATVAALAFVQVVEDAKETEHIGEALGIAKLAVTSVGYLRSATQTLADRALHLSLKDKSGLQKLLSVVMGDEDADA